MQLEKLHNICSWGAWPVGTNGKDLVTAACILSRRAAPNEEVEEREQWTNWPIPHLWGSPQTWKWKHGINNGGGQELEKYAVHVVRWQRGMHEHVIRAASAFWGQCRLLLLPRTVRKARSHIETIWSQVIVKDLNTWTWEKRQHEQRRRKDGEI